MKRIIPIPLVLLVSFALTWLAWMNPAKPTRAGALPCVMCHGEQFQGSDLAPRLAGTTLSDQAILEQIKHPRGIMPAFPEFAASFVVERIRAAPTGVPTYALAPADRSVALAMLAGVAKERATAFYRQANPQTATPRPSTTPTRVSAALAAPTSKPPLNKTDVNEWLAPLAILMTGGVAMFGTLWFWRRR